jgi:hypothetical protein
MALALAACAGPDVAASDAAIARFHAAIDADDIAAIDAMLTRSTRALRPGNATARAFRNLPRRHGRYLGGSAASITQDGPRTRIIWHARYAKGPVTELYVLAQEDGVLKLDSYSDDWRG